MGWDSESRSASENKAHAAAVERIRLACERHGVTPGIHVGDAETSFRYIEQGFRLLTVASDIGLIAGGAAATLQRVRSARTPAAGAGKGRAQPVQDRARKRRQHADLRPGEVLDWHLRCLRVTP